MRSKRILFRLRRLCNFVCNESISLSFSVNFILSSLNSFVFSQFVCAFVFLCCFNDDMLGYSFLLHSHVYTIRHSINKVIK